MPIKQLDTPYPVIDADPHFSRVVRSFRGSDYAAMAGATAAFPSAIYLMEMFDPTRPKRGLGSALRLSTFLGLCGGFLFAYQRTSFRFWGWKENEIEQAANQAALDAGIKPPGTDPSKSDLTPYMQGVAHRNSAFSQLKFSTLPWFNLVDHPYHGGNNSQESS
ncbi:related to NADH-ubiquinone oxidoreductase 21 kDa subunit [Ustilago trichophora]|uniref:Related to NADH-ubiquinone oxidoreductase 21 kDa subunit n=1 Tax=Ustilago trichophora TaxID=86804 RepID=A0A5C3EKD5_9BASI|nr:related to NADH-ubiquinone oxidoreductase 21 kDa subunit [Ustilago trichophora]